MRLFLLDSYMLSKKVEHDRNAHLIKYFVGLRRLKVLFVLSGKVSRIHYCVTAKYRACLCVHASIHTSTRYLLPCMSELEGCKETLDVKPGGVCRRWQSHHVFCVPFKGGHIIFKRGFFSVLA